jgi:hypothetical protein
LPFATGVCDKEGASLSELTPDTKLLLAARLLEVLCVGVMLTLLLVLCVGVMLTLLLVLCVGVMLTLLLVLCVGVMLTRLSSLTLLSDFLVGVRSLSELSEPETREEARLLLMLLF